MGPIWHYRLAVGSWLGLALFGAISHVQLLLRLPFTAALLPLGLILGILCALPGGHAPQDPGVPRDVAARTLGPVAIALVLLGVVAAALAYGSLAMPARNWDGFIAFEVKAAYLARTPTLEQDYFMGPGVFCHSRDYPVLQPLLVAAGHRLLGSAPDPAAGRWLFPLLYLLLVAFVWLPLRRLAAAPWLAPACALAMGVTPMLVGTTLGSADSGYGELFVATCMAGLGAGLVLRDQRLLFASAFLVVLAKPEGLVYGALPVAILWCQGQRPPLRAALLGFLLAAALWLPVQHRLLHPGQGDPPSLWIWAGLLLLGSAVLGSDAWLRRRRWGTRQRLRLAGVVVPLAMLALPLAAYLLGGVGGAMTEYLGDPARPLTRLQRLPVILGGMLDHAFGRMKFALTFPLLVALGIAWWRRRRGPPHRSLAAFLALGLLCCLAPFLLSPLEDTHAHIRSSMSRLLLHWLGVAWIAVGLWLGGLLAIDGGATAAPNGASPQSAPDPVPSPTAPIPRRFSADG